MSKRAYLLTARNGIWYYKLPDESAYHSTGIPHRLKNDRDIAAAYVQELLSGPPREDPRLDVFARDFYKWPDASYIQRQHAKGRSFEKAHAEACQGYLDHHIMPIFGKVRLSQLTKRGIEKAIITLPLANGTKNHILYALGAVLQDAVDAGLLTASPLARVEPLGKEAKARDAFLPSEYRALFPVGALASAWGRENKGVFFFLLSGTGIRSGEARALAWSQVLWADRALLVDRTVAKGGEIGPISQKKGGSKIVLLPSRVQAELAAWQEKSLWRNPEDLIFPGKARGIPLSSATVTHALSGAIKRVNAAAKKKELPEPIVVGDRNLVVHSFRHTYVSRLRRTAPRGLVSRLVGHQSEETTDIYDHPTQLEILKEFEPARLAIEELHEQG